MLDLYSSLRQGTIPLLKVSLFVAILYINSL